MQPLHIGGYMDRKQFYHSKEWLNFRQLIIAQRMDEDGYVHCAECGKPIVKKYDLIIHHKKELTEYNVGNAKVALNPDNVEIVCFRCHNLQHDRFVAGHKASYTLHKPVPKHVYIVYGAPSAGKSTWVRMQASDNDLVVDMDSIWQMISINERYVKPDALKSVVFEMRDKLYDIIRYRSGRWHNAYIIITGALKGDRDRLQQRVGADDTIWIDTPEEECLQRLQHREDMDHEQKEQWKNYITEFFQQFQSD